jgi:hypothetical protein
MQRAVRVGMGLLLVWMLGAPMLARSEGPAALSSAGSHSVDRLVVFEGFMRQT